MDYKKFFLGISDKTLGTLVKQVRATFSIEELYQAFKSRLLDEIGKSLQQVGSVNERRCPRCLANVGEEHSPECLRQGIFSP